LKIDYLRPAHSDSSSKRFCARRDDPDSVPTTWRLTRLAAPRQRTLPRRQHSAYRIPDCAVIVTRPDQLRERLGEEARPPLFPALTFSRRCARAAPSPDMSCAQVSTPYVIAAGCGATLSIAFARSDELNKVRIAVADAASWKVWQGTVRDRDQVRRICAGGPGNLPVYIPPGASSVTVFCGAATDDGIRCREQRRRSPFPRAPALRR